MASIVSGTVIFVALRPRHSRGILLTSPLPGSTFTTMEADENLPRRKDDLAAQLGKQDLDPLSVDELNERIALLESEIARCRSKIQYAINHRASADALFKR
jgi:uncharacterized small protein (DUF1192 family)